MTRAGAKALGLNLYASKPAAALTAITSPEGIDSGKIVKEFRESFDAVVANGQGEMKGKLFRIAHIGYYDYLDTIGILGALEHVLARVTGKTCPIRRSGPSGPGGLCPRAIGRAATGECLISLRHSGSVDGEVHRARGLRQGSSTTIEAGARSAGIGHCDLSRARSRDHCGRDIRRSAACR